MAKITPWTVENILWAVLCAGLIVAIGLETNWGATLHKPLVESTATTEPFAAPELAVDFKTPSADTFIAISARPLFVPSRSPAPPPPPPPNVESRPTMTKGQFLLYGTIQSPEGSFAQLAPRTGGKVRFIPKGAEIDGITVKEVGSDFVVLTQFGDEERLILRTAKAPTLQKSKGETPVGSATPQEGIQSHVSDQAVESSTPSVRTPRPPPSPGAVPTFGPRPSVSPPTQ